MKRGKDDEKNMSPMFPRLHVSDTEKGGPRAPPRNKMALYEQLSIPSQRFNSALRNNAAPLVPVVTSLSQGGGPERTSFPQFCSSPAPADSDDNIHCQSSDGVYTRNQSQKAGPKSTKLANYRASNVSAHPSSAAEYGSPLLKNSCYNNLGNDSDFSVPTFVDPRIPPYSDKDQHNEDRERLTPLSPIYPSHCTETSGNNTPKAVSASCNSSTHLHSARDKHLKRTNTTDLWSREHVRTHNEENLSETVTSKDYAERIASLPLNREKIAEPSKHPYISPNREHRSSPFDNIGQLQQAYAAGLLAENTVHNKSVSPEKVAPIEKENVLQARSEFPSRASRETDRNGCNEHRDDQTHGLSQATNTERNDDASETSMVDSISGFDISPDDVVGVIGQKHFWKARRAIVNQQRLFAVQVFELHRLIKVQKSIAGSPHLLLDHTAYLTKPIKAVPAKKQSAAEYLLEAPPQIVKQRVETHKPAQITESAAENAFAKSSAPSISGGVNREHVNQQSSHGQHHENPTPSQPPPPHAADTSKPNWSFQPPAGNQWLVPVMTPSEGLVYKPYSGPCPPASGFMAQMYGGCGPMAMGGEFPNPYNMPIANPHHQGMGVYPHPSQYPQPYFSPYAMPMMNPVISASSVEHSNPFAGAQSHGHADRISTGEVNINTNTPPRASRNIPTRRSEIQGSTASSPGEKAQRDGSSIVSDKRDALPLFPMAPAPPPDPEIHPEIQTLNSDHPHRRVIKVVPHNPRSATESAARIFQSIQEERQQYDSV
ncbi:hypothetical protein ACHQM5_028801 [Ranunculus cassubicifolius]